MNSTNTIFAFLLIVLVYAASVGFITWYLPAGYAFGFLLGKAIYPYHADKNP